MFSKRPTIKKIHARQILDSRGMPTIEVIVVTDIGIEGRSSVPSGASTGKKEAAELRDNSKEYFGKGVLQACENINTEINSALHNFAVDDQEKIDKRMIQADGTPDRGRLGGNSLIGVSQACVRAAANAHNIPLYKYLNKISGLTFEKKMPVPMFNLINGGLHAFNGLDIQEYLFIPLAKAPSEAIRLGAEVYHNLVSILVKKGLHGGVGDEGGEAPKLSSNSEPFGLINEAAEGAGYKSGKDYGLGIDAAANSFVEKRGEDYFYKFGLEKKEFSTSEILELYGKWIDEFKLLSIEDGLCEDDKEGWRKMNAHFADKIHVVGRHVEVIGDDLFVTSARRLVSGVEDKLANAIIIKPNQVGTISETIETVRTAKRHGFSCVASHRSGDTPDSFITDLAVGLGCEYLKAGAPARGERVAKYNRLMEIENEIL